jgi:hypothetical protein
MHEDKKHKEIGFESLKMPKPINIAVDKEGFYALTRSGDEIIRVGCEDYDAMYIAYRVLNGIVEAKLLPAEIEELRDILKDLRMM